MEEAQLASDFGELVVTSLLLKLKVVLILIPCESNFLPSDHYYYFLQRVSISDISY